MEISAGEFKAKCLKLMNQVANTREPIIITKRGRPVAARVKGIYEAILFIQAVDVLSRKVEIYVPIVYHTYNTT